MLYRTIIFVAWSLVSIQAAGQTRLFDYILANAAEVKSIRFEDTAYNDLKRIGETVANSRVVFLGEMWHGDGACFEAKSRLVRYLHEVKGFNVLAFEDDFYSLTRIADLQEINMQRVDTLILNNTSPIWFGSAQCTPLRQYIVQNPIMKLCGIDPQMNKELYRQQVKQELEAYFLNRDIYYIQTPFYKKHFWKGLDTIMNITTKYSFKNRIPYNRATFGIMMGSLDTIVMQLKEKKQSGDDFFMQTILNLKELCNMYYHLDNFRKASDIRNSQMGANLSWLARVKYPEEKIIVWLASSHMVKNNQEAYSKKSREVSTGAVYLQNPANPPACFIGFTSHAGSGNYQGNMKYKIPATKKNSVESAFGKNDKEYQFVSLKEFKAGINPAYVYGKIDGGNNIKAAWEQCVDGIFYIRTMTPASPR